MPNLRIETNVAKEKIKDLPGFLKELSSALARTRLVYISGDEHPGILE